MVSDNGADPAKEWISGTASFRVVGNFTPSARAKS
jgi:hypothetical protein